MVRQACLFSELNKETERKLKFPAKNQNESHFVGTVRSTITPNRTISSQACESQEIEIFCHKNLTQHLHGWELIHKNYKWNHKHSNTGNLCLQPTLSLFKSHCIKTIVGQISISHLNPIIASPLILILRKSSTFLSFMFSSVLAKFSFAFS